MKLDNIVQRMWASLFPPTVPPARIVVYRTQPAPIPPVSPAGSFLIGIAEKNRELVCALSWQLDRHLLIVGGTGCGKTTLIARLFTEEILKWQ